MDVLASKVKFYDAVECWMYMPEAIAELAQLTKFLQLYCIFTNIYVKIQLI